MLFEITKQIGKCHLAPFQRDLIRLCVIFYFLKIKLNLVLKSKVGLLNFSVSIKAFWCLTVDNNLDFNLKFKNKGMNLSVHNFINISSVGNISQ